MVMYSRLLPISTGKSVSAINNECNFPNTSHFIKPLTYLDWGTALLSMEKLKRTGKKE
jgi:AraC-like DNA-binding protein